MSCPFLEIPRFLIPPHTLPVVASSALVLSKLTRSRSSNASVDWTSNNTQQASYHQSQFKFDNVATRAAHCDLSAAQRALRQQTSMSSALNNLAASLNGSSMNHHATGTVQGTCTSGSDALLNEVGAQFGAHSSKLSSERHAQSIKER